MEQYFILRGDSLHPFYSISNRFDINYINQELIKYDEIIDINPVTDSSNVTTTLGYGFNCYRGDCYMGNVTMRIQRNFQDPDLPTNDGILDPNTWKSNYKGYQANGSINSEEVNKINRGDVNAVRIGHWATFFISSNNNICYRSIDERNTNEYALTGHHRSFFPLIPLNERGTNKIPDSYIINTGFNTTTSFKRYIKLADVPAIKSIFSNRIMYSEQYITDAFKNGYRIFQGLNYADLTNQYGAINKIFEFNGALIIIFENGVGLLPVKERAMIESEGGSIFIDNSNVIQDKIVTLSTNFGSSWQNGVVATPNYIYGIDTEGKKIWRTNGKEFEILSDFKVQKFLNEFIDLSESDKYVDILNKNVKVHYNEFKGDIMFTFYKEIFLQDVIEPRNKKYWSLTFNEQLNLFTSFNSWKPLISENINNIFFSADLENLYDYYWFFADKKKYLNKIIDALIAKTTNNEELNKLNAIKRDIPNYNTKKELIVMEEKYAPYIVDSFKEFYFYKHGVAGIIDNIEDPLPCFWYDKQYPFEFEFIVNAEPGIHKIFENLIIISNNAEPDSIIFSVVGDAYKTNKINLKDPKHNSERVFGGETILKTTSSKDKVELYQKIMNIWDSKYKRRLGNAEYVDDFWRIMINPLKFKIAENVYKDSRIRDKYCRIRIKYKGNNPAIITGLKTLYTQSYS